MEAEVRDSLREDLGRRVVRVIERRAPHEPDQHRGPEVAVHLPEDPRLGAALEEAAEAVRDPVAARPHDLLLAEEQPRLPLLHQPEEGEVAGERLHDRLDHPRQRDGRRELLRLDALEPRDEEVERLGDDAQVEVLLGREVAVERALADPRGLRDVVHADHVVGAGGEDPRRRPHDLLALRRLPRRPGSMPSWRRSRAPGVSRPGGNRAVDGRMELTGQSAEL